MYLEEEIKIGFLSWLFGRKDKKRQQSDYDEFLVSDSDPLLDKFYSLSSQIEEHKRNKQYSRMLQCCSESLPLLSGFVEGWKKDVGAFEISSIRALELGCRYWGALGDVDSLKRAASAIHAVPELEDWAGEVECALEDVRLSERIQDHLRDNPGFHQSKIGKALGVSGRDTASLIGRLVNLGIIRRERAGKTYALYLER